MASNNGVGNKMQLPLSTGAPGVLHDKAENHDVQRLVPGAHGEEDLAMACKA